MTSLLKKNILIIFGSFVLLDIIGLSFNVPALHFITKPLLMPVLIAAVLLSAPKTAGRNKIITALFFSFLGDVFLLFTDKLFFILGLVCFLLTHVLYIAWFIQLNKTGASLLRKYPYIIVAVVAYTLSLLYFLMPGLEKDLKIPVVVYACIISIMLCCSFNLPFSMNSQARYLLIAGAFSFIVSDSLLAIDKFYHSFAFAPVLIMLTYCIAQYFIVKGFIRNSN